MRHALFPISVNNELFSTDATVAALGAELCEYDKITFLIADRIQVYNDIAKRGEDLDAIISLDWSGHYRRDFIERTRWLRRLRHQVQPPERQRWKIIGVDDAADRHTYAALRSTWLLYRFDSQFAADVQIAAEDFAERKDVKQTDLLREMSLAYLLEEIAINIRLRVLGRIRDEFYMGSTLPILPQLYDGHYLKTAEEMMGRSVSPPGTYSFWSWREGQWSPWDSAPGKGHLRLISGG